MYAIRGGSRTYHLVNTRTGLTLCGLPTLPVRIRRKNGTGLTHTPTRPLDAILCKHCLRLSAPEDQVTLNQDTEVSSPRGVASIKKRRSVN
jgi:hypothetical protein